MYLEIFGGGYGAGAGTDGCDGVDSPLSNCTNTPVEALDQDFPFFRVIEYALRQDSCGVGEQRGGLGFRRRYEILREGVRLSLYSDRFRRAPDGLFGGGRGRRAIARWNAAGKPSRSAPKRPSTSCRGTSSHRRRRRRGLRIAGPATGRVDRAGSGGRDHHGRTGRILVVRRDGGRIGPHGILRRQPSSLALVGDGRRAAARRPAFAGEASVDLAVVGGGITGCMAALTAAEAGASTLLLEGTSIGWGASGRNGGQVIPGLKYDPSEMRASTARWRDGASRRRWVGPPTSCSSGSRGTPSPATRSAKAGSRRPMRCGAGARAAARAGLGGGGRPRLAPRCRGGGAPDRRAGAIAAGWIDRRAGTLHPLSYTRGLARAAQAAGAALHEDSPVDALEPAGDGWRLRTPGGTIRARRVVVGTDAYSTPLVTGLPEAMLRVQSVQIATEPLPEAMLAQILPDGRCCSETRRLAFYFAARRTGGCSSAGAAPSARRRAGLPPGPRGCDAADLPGGVRRAHRVELVRAGRPDPRRAAPGAGAGARPPSRLRL